MPQPQPARAGGERLTSKRREIPFSFWPARAPQRGRHHALQSRLFALDPWIVIQRAIEEQCAAARLPEALATLAQARDFYIAGTSADIVAAKPLVLYYSYMNLMKAYCLTKGGRATFDKAQHGLTASMRAQGRGLADAYLEAFPSPNRNGDPNNFAEIMDTLTGVPLAANASYDVEPLIAQIISGHRHWAMATKKRERFIELADIQFWFDDATNQMWLRLYLFAEDLTRLDVSHRAFLSQSGLAPLFREVRCPDEDGEKRRICFEEIQTHPCGNYRLDQVNAVAKVLKPYLWTTVATVSPYRRYYAYLCPQAEVQHRLEQLLSIYAVTYYFGSITRYRPQDYDKLMSSAWGARVQDFVTGQPAQFVYMLASEFIERDVTRPSIL